MGASQFNYISSDSESSVGIILDNNKTSSVINGLSKMTVRTGKVSWKLNSFTAIDGTWFKFDYLSADEQFT